MNLAQVARILAGFAAFFGLSAVVPLAVSLYETETEARYATTSGFGACIVLGLAVAALLRFGGGRAQPAQFFRKEGIAVVAFAWLLAGALAAVPFVWSGALRHGADALFESFSGLTTTGASVFGSSRTPAVESLPASLLLWRAMLQWMGGLGIILAFLVLLPAMGAIGKNLLSSEYAGIGSETIRPRLQEQGRLLFRLYSALTLAAFGLLTLCGMPAFDALCHAMTTLSTGGYSTRNASIGAYESLPIELVVLVFMWIGGTNFPLLYAWLTNGVTRPSLLWQSPEFRLYVYYTLLVDGLVTIVLRLYGAHVPDDLTGSMHDYSRIGECLRHAAFNVVSVMTSTGYCSVDFQQWPRPAVMILIGCMLIGACTGSTSGGLKILRLLVFLKLITYTVRHFIRPKSIEKLKVDDQVLPNAVVSAILAMALLWAASVGLGAMLLSLEPGMGVLSSLSSSASMLGCTGPGLTAVTRLPTGEFGLALDGAINVGPYGSFGELPGWAKIVMSFQMLLGRLEILPLLALLAPSFWRR